MMDESLPQGGLPKGGLPLMVPSFQGKHRVICAFREIARSIAQTHDLCADVDNILFVIDEAAEKPSTSASEIFRIPELWQDVLFQTTLRKFNFLIKFVDVNIEAIRGNKKVFAALVYHELRHIKKSPKTGELYLDKTHDIEDWSELVKYGDWERKIADAANLPDLLQSQIK